MCFTGSALSEHSCMNVGTCITYEDRCVVMFTNDETLPIHIKSKVQFLRLVTRSHSKPRIQRTHFSSNPLKAAELGLAAKPTGMGQPQNNPPLEPTVGHRAVQDQD